MSQPRDGEEKTVTAGMEKQGGEGRVAQDDMVYSVREGDMCRVHQWGHGKPMSKLHPSMHEQGSRLWSLQQQTDEYPCQHGD